MSQYKVISARLTDQYCYYGSYYEYRFELNLIEIGLYDSKTITVCFDSYSNEDPTGKTIEVDDRNDLFRIVAY